MRTSKSLFLFFALVGLLGGGQAQAETPTEFFELKVRPLLVARCLSCHGANDPKGGLRLDTREGGLKGGGRGPAIVPGQPDKSLLLHAITPDVAKGKGGLQMPPGDALKPDQIAILTEWVRQGAVWPASAKSEKPEKEEPLWALAPLRKPALPKVRQKAWVATPLDAFVLAPLEAKGLRPAPPASKRELMRRVYFDLIGLPPTPQEVTAYLADTSPNAYAKLIDRLLASPHYGERWARYWLDLVRYADTNGYERDAEKPYSWKYRDYVIRALNTDKSYARFVTEQLAGDELPNRTEETVAATGFLRLGTWDDEPNDPVAYKYDRLDDLVHATGAAFLGLTVRCARCHDHKFDPIPQKDYYAFASAFYGGYLEPGDGRLMGGPPRQKLGFDVLGFTDRGREAPPARLLKSGDPRREEEAVAPGYLTLVSHLKREVQPPPADATTTYRRLQLAAWMTEPTHPLTWRVVVNRVWQHHFGQGLVRTPNNFGRKGTPPTHPELLDYLATEFLRQGGHFKALHRLILLSSTYRMASRHPRQAAYARKDAENLLLWRANRQRLDADALRDAMLAVSGGLNLKAGGPGFVPTVTREALEGLSRKGAEWNPSPPEEQRRRSVYLFLKRALIPPMMTTFDFGDTTAPLEQRDVTTVAPQALALLNNPFIHEVCDTFARRVEREVGTDRARQVERVWWLVFGRGPTPEEREAGLTHLRAMATLPRFSTPPMEKPSLQSKMRLWLRADKGVQADAEGRVSQWADQSGLGHHALQPLVAAQPLQIASVLKGQPALRFDGKGQFLTLVAPLLTSQPFSIVAVASDRAGNGSHREILSNWNGAAGNAGTSVFLGTTGAGTVRLTDSFPSAGTLSHPEQPSILMGIGGADGVAVFQNRRELARVAQPLPTRNLMTPWVIGQQGNINGEFWNGDIFEVQVYNHPLSAEERQQVWNALSQRYGIAPAERPADLALASLCRVLLNTNAFLYVD